LDEAEVGSGLDSWYPPRGGDALYVTLLGWAGAFFAVVAALLSLPILAFAFRRSLGTGLMVLLIPFYVFLFATKHFEHPRKVALVCSWFACLGLAAVLLAVHHAVSVVAVDPFG
jgi:translocator protein